MIEDILFESEQFVMDIPLPPLGGEIEAYSMDGNNYDYLSEIVQVDNKETSKIYIT